MGMKISVRLDAEKVFGKLEKAPAHIESALDKWQYFAGKLVKDTAYRNAPYNKLNTSKPHMRDSLYVQVKGTVIQVGSNNPVAGYMEMGTRPHAIVPNASRQTRTGRPSMLKFQSGGNTFFARMVNHPGTKPYRFLRNALAEQKDYLVKLAERLLKDELQF
jgi:hypothetical protein